MGGWTNTQAETITGLALTYLTTTVLFSTGSSFTLNADATFSSATDLNLTSGAGITFDGPAPRLAKDAGTWLAVDGTDMLPATLESRNQLATFDTNVSAAYVDVIGASVTITKKGSTTVLKLEFAGSLYSDAINTLARFGVSVDGGPAFDIAQLYFNNANQHLALSGVALAVPAATYPPGAHTCQLQWKRISGAGQLVQTGVDYNSLTVSEC